MKTILELSHIKARQYFLESQNYCNMQFPKYIDFKPVIEYVQNSVGNKELRDILKDPNKSRKTKRDGCEKRNAFIETKTKCASNLIRKVTVYLQNQSKTPSLYIKINGIQMDF